MTGCLHLRNSELHYFPFPPETRISFFWSFIELLIFSKECWFIFQNIYFPEILKLFQNPFLAFSVLTHSVVTHPSMVSECKFNWFNTIQSSKIRNRFNLSIYRQFIGLHKYGPGATSKVHPFIGVLAAHWEAVLRISWVLKGGFEWGESFLDALASLRSKLRASE